MKYPDGASRQTAHLTEQTQLDILDASEETYGALVERFHAHEAKVHQLGLCIYASRLMQDNLEVKGYRPEQVQSPACLFHIYLKMHSSISAQDVLIDPTWQQFMQEKLITAEMPKVLIGTSEEVIAVGRRYGLDDLQLGVYATSPPPIQAC